MHKACRMLAFVSALMVQIACGDATTTTGHDAQTAPMDVDGGASDVDGGASNCVEVALACVTYTCVNSGDCDPKNVSSTPAMCYKCIAAATAGALCKHFIDSCGQMAACFK